MNPDSSAPLSAAVPIRFHRRSFLQATTLAAAGLSLPGWAESAAPATGETWDQFIPAEKRLPADWVRSLFERGQPTAYTKSRDELRFIGMPIGGIGCGTLYLSGDGRLWNWDIFNQKIEGVLPRRLKWSDLGMNFETGDPEIRPRDGATYAKPAVPSDSPPIAQGFALRTRVRGPVEVRAMEASGWSEVKFTGQYPVGTVEYSDPAAAVRVKLEAYSPFLPLQADDSGIPATVFRFSLTNPGRDSVEVELAGWLQNATCWYSARPQDGQRINRVLGDRRAPVVSLEFHPPAPTNRAARPDLVVQDFERGYGDWRVEGEAFGTTPATRETIPTYQGAVGGEGEAVANSHASAPGSDVGDKDNRKGRLISPPVRLQRRFLSFYIGGGRRAEVGLRVRVAGRVVGQATGHDGNAMRREALDVSEFEGQDAVIEIFDEAAGGWGNIGVDQIVQTDAPPTGTTLERRLDFGTMALGCLGRVRRSRVVGTARGNAWPAAAFETRTDSAPSSSNAPVAVVAQSAKVAPGQTVVFHFAVAWNFPNTSVPVPDARTGNYYARRFSTASSVVRFLSENLGRLESGTFRWRDTWYDSTLPHWFLERTFTNTSTLATTTTHRLATGRLWGWEGIGCCEGTCTHVWHYAQAVGRLFPELEQDQRERVDFGVGFDGGTGVVRHRGEGSGPAIDGQCGRILGAWREHQMSVDDAFLHRLWPRIKAATEYLIRHDTDGDGIPDGAQENTLDAAWYGQISWITSLTLAALRAAEEMAKEQGDTAFAARCRAHFEKGRVAVETQLFNGEYFIQRPDPSRPKTLGTYEACHIDQVHGQSWAWQVGLGRVLDREKTLSALRALWKYNFAPDVGPFRKRYTAGRPYALAGEAGLVMTSNPRLVPNVYGKSSWQIGYFNECMSGFEHQAASHLMAEGLVLEAFAVVRAIHDRYHAARRNPFNEIECSDHYARAMASYGTFLTACGFETHGPQGYLGFAPRLTPENFRAPFTAAGGWGTYTQRRDGGRQTQEIQLRYGEFLLRRFETELAAEAGVARVEARSGSVRHPATCTVNGRRCEVRFEPPVQLNPTTPLQLTVEIAQNR